MKCKPAPLLYREESIFVNSIEKFKEIQSIYKWAQYFTFICQKCGNEFSIKKSAATKLQKTFCTDCRRKETMFQKYGVENPFQDKEKIKKAVLEKYGVDNPSKLDFVKEKKQSTMISHFGVKYNFQRECVKEKLVEDAEENFKKLKESIKQKYGVDNPSQLDFVKEKKKKTCLKHFGVEFAAQRPGTIGRNKKFRFKDIIFDSSWEMAFWIWLEDNDKNFRYQTETLTYITEDNKEHAAKIDFWVEGQLIEIKGPHLLKDGILWDPWHKKFQKEKTECYHKNKVRILSKDEIEIYLNYVKSRYGENFLREHQVEEI